MRILARVKVFPGMSEGVPLVITSARALNAASAKLHLFDPLDVPATYIWVKGPPAAIEQAFGRTSLQPYYVVSVDTYLKNSDFLLATRTLSYMRIVAIASGVLVLIGLLLYLQARQRPQAIASALARRMGLRRRTEILSLSLELGAIVFFAAAIGAVIAIAAAAPITKHLDPLPEYPPSPVFAIPTAVILVSAGRARLALGCGRRFDELVCGADRHRARPFVSPEPLVTCRALSKTYVTPSGGIEALHSVDASFALGEITAVVGASGSGKSTLLRALAGLDRPTSGRPARRWTGHRRCGAGGAPPPPAGARHLRQPEGR